MNKSKYKQREHIKPNSSKWKEIKMNATAIQWQWNCFELFLPSIVLGCWCGCMKNSGGCWRIRMMNNPFFTSFFFLFCFGDGFVCWCQWAVSMHWIYWICKRINFIFATKQIFRRRPQRNKNKTVLSSEGIEPPEGWIYINYFICRKLNCS